MYNIDSEPILRIGILTAPEISLELPHSFYCPELGSEFKENIHFSIEKGAIKVTHHFFNNSTHKSRLRFKALNETSNFVLDDVNIGIGFHWEQKEQQAFKGEFELIIHQNKLVCINHVKLEDYITSVISSEMNANAPIEFLKAHAVMSRSWAMAQLKNAPYQGKPSFTDQEIINWYDKDNHTEFDLCADDHCQRYQGITRVVNNNALKAIEDTKGEFLMYDGAICDARFSKCCGGISEDFEAVWQPEEVPYLKSVIDSKSIPYTSIENDSDFSAFLESSPEVFCNTNDAGILNKVLNDYDAKTQDFFRWEENFTQQALSELVNEKSGIDFGLIKDLVPLKRGKSGRIIALKIVGEKKTLTIGKELEIRKYLSKSHLYSSAFKVSKSGDSFTLKGLGWGHGVGLCQIGAAVMSEKSYNYKEILEHYFTYAQLAKLY